MPALRLPVTKANTLTDGVHDYIRDEGNPHRWWLLDARGNRAASTGLGQLLDVAAHCGLEVRAG